MHVRAWPACAHLRVRMRAGGPWGCERARARAYDRSAEFRKSLRSIRRLVVDGGPASCCTVLYSYGLYSHGVDEGPASCCTVLYSYGLYSYGVDEGPASCCTVCVHARLHHCKHSYVCACGGASSVRACVRACEHVVGVVAVVTIVGGIGIEVALVRRCWWRWARGRCRR